jgi:hypothetical protein
VRHHEIDDEAATTETSLAPITGMKLDSTTSAVGMVQITRSPTRELSKSSFPHWIAEDDVISAERGDISGLRVNLIELVI